MTAGEVIVAVLLALAAIVNIAGGIAMVAFTNPYSRMHYANPPALFSSALVLAAVFIEHSNWPVIWKSLLAVILLLVSNAVLTYATARAIKVRQDKEKKQ